MLSDDKFQWSFDNGQFTSKRLSVDGKTVCIIGKIGAGSPDGTVGTLELDVCGSSPNQVWTHTFSNLNVTLLSNAQSSWTGILDRQQSKQPTKLYLAAIPDTSIPEQRFLHFPTDLVPISSSSSIYVDPALRNAFASSITTKLSDTQEGFARLLDGASIRLFHPVFMAFASLNEGKNVFERSTQMQGYDFRVKLVDSTNFIYQLSDGNGSFVMYSPTVGPTCPFGCVRDGGRFQLTGSASAVTFSVGGTVNGLNTLFLTIGGVNMEPSPLDLSLRSSCAGSPVGWSVIITSNSTYLSALTVATQSPQNCCTKSDASLLQACTDVALWGTTSACDVIMTNYCKANPTTSQCACFNPENLPPDFGNQKNGQCVNAKCFSTPGAYKTTFMIANPCTSLLCSQLSAPPGFAYTFDPAQGICVKTGIPTPPSSGDSFWTSATAIALYVTIPVIVILLILLLYFWMRRRNTVESTTTVETVDVRPAERTTTTTLTREQQLQAEADAEEDKM